MKVTKFIKEYVESEIYRKFRKKLESSHAEYHAEVEALKDKLKEIANEASTKAWEVINESGFTAVSGYGGAYVDKLIVVGCINIVKPDVEKAIKEESRALSEKKDKLVYDTLIGLELGVSTKEELNGILDAIEF